MKRRLRPSGNDRIARWVGFIALVALLAMATLPFSNPDRDTTAATSLHGSSSWHG